MIQDLYKRVECLLIVKRQAEGEYILQSRDAASIPVIVGKHNSVSLLRMFILRE